MLKRAEIRSVQFNFARFSVLIQAEVNGYDKEENFVTQREHFWFLIHLFVRDGVISAVSLGPILSRST